MAINPPIACLLVVANALCGWAATEFDSPPPAELYPATWLTYPQTNECTSGENTGYFRKPFLIPADRIFSAIVEIPLYDCALYANGQLVYRASSRISKTWRYWTHGLNIAPYLHAGTNVIGLQALGGSVYLHGNVIMESGETLSLASDTTWKYAPDAPANWSSAVYNDSAWATTQAQNVDLNTLRFHKPAYQGLLILENPYEDKLFYSDTNDVIFTVRVPAGLAADNPRLNFDIHQVETGRETAAGVATTYKNHQGSLCFDITAGKQARGVYVVSLTLESRTKTIAQRNNEVFIVCGKIEQKEVTGASFEEGMGLIQEDVINCYDPNDPHIFMDGGDDKSTVVMAQGMAYREAGRQRGIRQGKLGLTGQYDWHKSTTGFFAYMIKYQAPDTPYLIVLEYPDDKERAIQFQINETPVQSTNQLNDCDAYYRESAGTYCGGIFPLSNKSKRLPILLFPSRKEAIVTVNTAVTGKPAAACRILIYRISEIPALKVNQSQERFIGTMAYGNCFQRMLDSYCPPEINLAPARTAPVPLQSIWGQYWNPKVFAMWFRATERLIQYLRFTGQNTYVVDCYMYSNEYPTPYASYHTPYTPTALLGAKTSRLEADYREIMAKLFGENTLTLFASIVFQMHSDILSNPLAKYTDSEVGQGAETLWYVDKQGKQILNLRGLPAPGNLFHPAVQETILRIVDDVGVKLAAYASFKGLFSLDFEGAGITLLPHGGMEDYTINLFTEETKIQIPIPANDPNRFAQRFAWFQSHPDEAQRYSDWRCQKIFDFRRTLSEHLRHYRKDLELLCLFSTVESPLKIKEDVALDVNLKKYYGQDIQLYAHASGITWTHILPPIYFYWLDASKRPGFNYNPKLLPFNDATYRFLLSAVHPYDNNLISNPMFSNLWPWQHMSVVGSYLPAEYFGALLTQATIDSDPNGLLIPAELHFNVGYEQMFRNFARGYLPLPAQELKRIAGPNIDNNIVIRSGLVKKRILYYLINPGWWPAHVTLDVKTKTGNVTDLTTGALIPTCQNGNRTLIDLTLPPFGTRSLAIQSPKATLLAATVQATEARSGLSAMIAVDKALIQRPNIMEILAIDEQNHMHNTLNQAETALKAGRFTQSWQCLLDKNYQRLLNAKVKTAEHTIPWMIIGPFANSENGLKHEDETLGSMSPAESLAIDRPGFDTVYEVEQETLTRRAPQQEKNYVGALNQKVQWQNISSVNLDNHAYVDFTRYFKPSNWTVGYAWTKVYSDTAQSVKLLTGSDDGIKVWLNGQMIYSILKTRSAQWGVDQVVVTLGKGENQVLVKAENLRGDFGFYLDFTDAENRPLTNIRYKTK